MMNKKVEFSNQDKIIFPKAKLTKKAIIDYYKKIADYILPHLKARPVTLERYPEGINKNGFFQKNKSDYFPNWLDFYEISNKDGTTTEYVLINNVDSLLFLINQAVITPHIWLSQKNDIKKPDKIVFDLDPTKKDYRNLVIIAKSIKKYLDSIGLVAYVMSTGSNGVHIILPIKPELSFEQIHEFAKKISEKIVNKNPKIATIEQRKDKRDGKVFIDYLRNSYGQTSVCPYAIRPKENAPIATPLSWDELTSSFNPQRYTIKNIFRRLAQKNNPWKDIYTNRKSVKKIINNI